MAVVNMTPDSFSNDGLLKRKFSPQRVVAHVNSLIDQGADIIDVGAESCRPGASRISSRSEISRLFPALRMIAKGSSVPVSIDSYKTDVIHAALDCGVSIVNNIQGLKKNKSLLKLVQQYNAAIVLMHMKGTSRNMHQKTSYRDLIKEIVGDLRSSLEFCLDFGIKKDRIIIDPGIGFSKTPQQNIDIIKHLDRFSCLRVPILVGPSRKSFLGKALKDMNKNRLAATAASVSASILHGAKIVRVHDVAFMKDVITITDLIKNS